MGQVVPAVRRYRRATPGPLASPSTRTPQHSHRTCTNKHRPDGEWVYSIVDDKLYLKSPDWDSPSLQRQLLSQIDREDVEQHYRKTYQTGSKALFFGKNKDQNETWLPLLEKAYSKAHGDYASMIGGWIGECLEDMTGGVTTELLSSDILDTDAFWDEEISKVNQEFMFGCSTGLLDGGYGNRDGITERHAYVVMDAKTLKSGQRLVKLRNPWGKLRKGVWEGAYADGSKEWTADVQKELGHTFGNDSVFWIPYEDLLAKYQHIDRTRLFRDGGWRSCQRWIGVDVPWKPDYHEKFRVKLTRDSPLVFSLSQLDRRYFKGLEGQYRFRLHFRVHEVGRTGAEDYIVRSHGNYLMTRSVSVEIPDMPAGEYTVFLLVTAERSTCLPSVEDVVRRECKRRKQNEKLAQVGYAYDLAHSKAHHHLEKVKEMRSAADKEKASASRRKERRKQWERRRTDRDIRRKQAKKNEEKKARLMEERGRKAAEEEGESSSESEETQDEKKAEETSAEKPVDKPAETPAEEKSEDKLADADKSDGKPAEDEADSKPADEAEAKPDKEAQPKADAALGGTPQSEPKIEDAKEAVSEKDKDKDSKPETEPSAQEPSRSRSSSKSKASKSKDKESRKAKKAAPPPDTGDYSSDSPVEDWEAIYSDDDYVRKPRTQPIPDVSPDDLYPTEDEKLPDPWNAVCIVGFKVWSKDEDLELRVIMEGGKLEEGGMGVKGERDLDNAQENAAGGREGEDDEGAGYEAIVVEGEGEVGQTEEEDGDDESEGDDVVVKKGKKKTGKAKVEEVKEDAGESKAQDESKPDEGRDPPAETKPEDKKEDSPEKPSDKPSDADAEKQKEEPEKPTEAELAKQREEEMRKKEERIRQWEEELRKKEEEIRRREEEMKRKSESEKKEEEEYVDCEGNTSSSGMSTPSSTPFQELQKELA